LEAVFGRYKAQIRSFSGVYSKEIKNGKCCSISRKSITNEFRNLYPELACIF